MFIKQLSTEKTEESSPDVAFKLTRGDLKAKYDSGPISPSGLHKKGNDSTKQSSDKITVTSPNRFRIKEFQRKDLIKNI